MRKTTRDIPTGRNRLGSGCEEYLVPRNGPNTVCSGMNKRVEMNDGYPQIRRSSERLAPNTGKD